MQALVLIQGDNLHSVTLSQSTLGERFRSVPEYSGRGILACARVLVERIFSLSQSALLKGLYPEPE